VILLLIRLKKVKLINSVALLLSLPVPYSSYSAWEAKLVQLSLIATQKNKIKHFYAYDVINNKLSHTQQLFSLVGARLGGRGVTATHLQIWPCYSA